jgi:hypothetical protein
MRFPLKGFHFFELVTHTGHRAIGRVRREIQLVARNAIAKLFPADIEAQLNIGVMQVISTRSGAVSTRCVLRSALVM